MKKERIDNLLVADGFAETLPKAQALVMSGVVLVDERRVEKASEQVPFGSVIRIKGSENRYVGRGGIKLEAALLAFGVDPRGLDCLDIGSSTGGFTDCLLQHGAKHVVAVDAGTNQLVWTLRTDPRVDVRENTNARTLVPGDFESLFDLVVMDVSFISATKIVPAIFSLLTDNGHLIVLIKPQFEVSRHEVGPGGIVSETEKHERVVNEVNAFSSSVGLKLED